MLEGSIRDCRNLRLNAFEQSRGGKSSPIQGTPRFARLPVRKVSLLTDVAWDHVGGLTNEYWSRDPGNIRGSLVSWGNAKKRIVYAQQSAAKRPVCDVE